MILPLLRSFSLDSCSKTTHEETQQFFFSATPIPPNLRHFHQASVSPRTNVNCENVWELTPPGSPDEFFVTTL